MPYVHPLRRIRGGGALREYDDELVTLYSAGVRAVVSLLNLPTDAIVYESAGFSFLCSPVPDGNAPTISQALDFVKFVSDQLALQKPVAVHCQAGIGRTGTALAAYLISQGRTADAAIRQVRAVEPSAIETPRQVEFLEQFSRMHP